MAVRRWESENKVVFGNNLGFFHIPKTTGQFGTGYIQLWEMPNSKLAVTKAKPIDTGSGAGYLNDSKKGVGIGAFGAYVAFGPAPWTYWDQTWGPWPPSSAWTTGSRCVGSPGITSASEPFLTPRTYRQTLRMVDHSMTLKIKWKFDPNDVILEASLRFHPTRAFWIKEPQFCFSLNEASKIRSIATPGTSCKPYTELFNPARRTGRCHDPKRHKVRLYGWPDIAVDVYDRDFRKMSDDMRNWPKAGEVGCMTSMGYKTEPFDNWEYTAWKDDATAPFYDSFSLLFKAEEGCVAGGGTQEGWEKWVAPSYYRRPPNTREYNFAMKIARA